MGFLSPSDWTNAFSSDAKDAAYSQYLMGMASLNLQRDMFDKQQANMAPFVQSAQTNIGRLNALMQPGGQLDPTKRFSMNDFQADPGYAFRKQEGVNALTAQGAAAGNLGSGNMGTALQNFGQNIASDEYNNAFNRWMGQNNNEFNIMAGMSNPNAVEQVGGWGMNTAANMGNTMTGMGNALAAGTMNQAAIRNAGMSNLGNSLGNGVGNWLMSDSGYGGNNASWLGNQMFGNSGQAGTLYSGDMSLDNASMGDSAGWGSGISNWWSSLWA